MHLSPLSLTSRSRVPQVAAALPGIATAYCSLPPVKAAALPGAYAPLLDLARPHPAAACCPQPPPPSRQRSTHRVYRHDRWTGAAEPAKMEVGDKERRARTGRFVLDSGRQGQLGFCAWWLDWRCSKAGWAREMYRERRRGWGRPAASGCRDGVQGYLVPTGLHRDLQMGIKERSKEAANQIDCCS